MAQLMPLPLTVSCFSKIQIGFTFLVPAHPGSPGKKAVKRVCVCTHEEGEVNDDEHRPGADGAAEDGCAAGSTSLGVGVSAAAATARGAAASAGVRRPSRVGHVHAHRAHHPVVHHRARRSPPEPEPEVVENRKPPRIGRFFSVGKDH